MSTGFNDLTSLNNSKLSFLVKKSMKTHNTLPELALNYEYKYQNSRRIALLFTIGFGKEIGASEPNSSTP
ncbi:hypothetical protein AYI70_g5748 [Smittium culicis]|uniref:Uncharacterized protein n=1 Tax=Smittium culicis TaxID=133412 RepID=A0A1R1XT16_9FUNG|nr:hypothetical protein AYI70_g5748 [Smittium culicis]